jgi:hypothetical protein
MKKIIIIMLTLFFLTGCGKMITVPIDSSLISKDEATVIIYHDQGLKEQFRIFLDKEQIGFVTSETPLKFSVRPGQHTLNTRYPMIIGRITNATFEAEKTYFMRIWLDQGMWVSSLRIDLTQKIETYKVRSYR